MFHILVVEDDRNTRKLLEAVLRKNGYNVVTAENGRDALAKMERQHVDLIVLDVMMPDMDGIEFTRTLRGGGCMIPVLMATAKILPKDKRKGFLAGTDDYMTKPIDLDEMLLRVQALLRRSQAINAHRLSIGEVVLEYDTLTVSRGGETQNLPQKEFQLLYKLLSFPGKIFTRMELMDEIWGMESESGDTTVNVHINRLRRRFEAYPEFDLVSVRGLGYKAVRNV